MASGNPDRTADTARAASDLLFRHWQEGTSLAQLPDGLRPATRAEGYAIQAHLESRSAVPPFGWKIAATSQAGQAHINVDGPLAGRLLAERVIAKGDAVPVGANRMRVAEPEFAFRMRQDLPPRSTDYDVSEVMAAVGALHLAVEVPDSRFEDFTVAGAAQLIADNACAHLFVLGPEAPASWRDIDLTAHVVRGRAGLMEREGNGAAVLGDPRVALTWLVNELSSLAVPLKAGQVVTTGTCMQPLPIEPGAVVEIDYGAFGRLVVPFGA
ncbi:2-keto-4-pentenoate hydratase [Marinivivus vitaminiproducens]|uniref:2-keto-4-pentenoate hydratase n=1 Tax=Marinivivus vitaminiproducens TaxID=3035935 RepID=UPI0027AA6490|nr:hydratase [Geminicoccaceae bacterium SCSIO 64248]